MSNFIWTAIAVACGFGLARFCDWLDACWKARQVAKYAAMIKPWEPPKDEPHTCWRWIIGVPLYGEGMKKVRADTCRDCLSERELIDANDGLGWRRDPGKIVAELKAAREERGA